MICDCIGEFTIYDLRFAIALDHLGIDSFAGGRLYSTAAHCTGGSSSRSTEYGVATDAQDSPAPQASGCLSEANPQGRKGPSASLPLHIRGGRNRFARAAGVGLPGRSEPAGPQGAECGPPVHSRRRGRRRYDTSAWTQNHHLFTTIYISTAGLPITCLTVILIDIPVRSAGGGLHGQNLN